MQIIIRIQIVLKDSILYIFDMSDFVTGILFNLFRLNSGDKNCRQNTLVLKDTRTLKDF